MTAKSCEVLFVGAGPGDPDLITVKGMRALQEADVVIFAGSLVPREVLSWTRSGCEIHDSASLALDEQVALMVRGVRAGRKVVRLHTGDPAIYGAIGEQMRSLDKENIAYSIIPGVSSFLATAAALKTELTLPGITQTVILTRAPGRTPVPETEKLADLAAHGTTLVLFLSSALLEETLGTLRSRLPATTPAAMVQRASWPEQKIIRGTLETIAEQAKQEGIDKTALLVVGRVLDNQGLNSLLYDPGFTHACREARDA